MRNEKGLLATAILAALTHQIAYLLVILPMYYYLTAKPRDIYRLFLVILPFAALSLCSYLRFHDIGYCVNVHFVFARTYWDTALLSVPLKSTIEAALATPVRAGGKETPVSPLSAAQVVFLWFTYLGGIVLSWKHRHIAALAYGLPFIVFLSFYQVWFFVPRFPSYCFPLLISYGHLIERR